MSKPALSQCAACQQVFSSLAAFDFHRVGVYAPHARRRCLTTREMLAEGLLCNLNGCWDFDPAKPNRASQAYLAARYGQAQQQSARRASA